ncbi:hypothetical protein [Pseudomonas saponiphila]|uniref:hypothetical protein n=1 Tax=Pseudomonas saponiphila TaxID=556534 RepID=UPI0022405551|nr:hypothetical protein [Pseudomonas saponiphila]
MALLDSGQHQVVATWAEALMLLCLAEVHDDDDGAEALSGQRYGEDLGRKWRY